jgi:hypothetical protein
VTISLSAFAIAAFCAFSASRAATAALLSAICLVSSSARVCRAVRSDCSLVISSAFFRAAAFNRFSCTVPRCAYWFTTPLQIPSDKVVVAAMAGLPAPSIPATMTGTTNAEVARRRAVDEGAGGRETTGPLSVGAVRAVKRAWVRMERLLE